jgi:hypothetical protein
MAWEQWPPRGRSTLLISAMTLQPSRMGPSDKAHTTVSNEASGNSEVV